MKIPHPIYSSADGHLGCFQFETTVKNGSLDIHVHVLVWMCFIPLRQTPRSVITGTHNKSKLITHPPHKVTLLLNKDILVKKCDRKSIL